MKHKIDIFNAVVILVVGALLILAVIAFGESDIAWILP